MSRRSFRAGAFAAAITLLTLFGAEGSGAAAENQMAAPSIVLNLPDQSDSSQVETPRFVATEVVQPLPASQPDQTPVAKPSSASSLAALVETTVPSGALSRDMRCLAEAVYFESRGEPLAGQLAVARVIVNRAESGIFPPDYCGVVTQKAQFSFVKNGRIPPVPESSVAWTRAKAIARIAHEELWSSQAQDALFFHATYVKPSWARTKLARATIDSHIFYR